MWKKARWIILKDEKKIGILTFHYAHNYGAMLQSYALVKVLDRLGYSAEIIDYRLQYIDQYVRKETIDEVIKKEGTILGVMKFVKRYLAGEYRRDKQWYQFESFNAEFLRKSKQMLTQKKDLKTLCYDAYISGSDQIWNLNLTDNAWEYFLDFVSGDELKIAYATSNGKANFEGDNYKIINKLIMSYDYVSVREKQLADFICKNVRTDAEFVLDPTLLLSKEEWNEVIIPYETKQQQYIFVYLVELNDVLLKNVIEYAKKLEKKVVVLAYEKLSHYDNIEQLHHCHPLKFISYIKNADMVVTNSYHGLCFSIIFGKEFWVYSHSNLNERISSLIEMLGLNERLIDRNVLDEIDKIDYEMVRNIIEAKKEKSIEFLRKALMNV